MKFVIIVAVFCVSFPLIYKWLKKQSNYWGNELSEDSFEDKKNNIENELKEIDKKLKETEKELGRSIISSENYLSNNDLPGLTAEDEDKQ